MDLEKITEYFSLFTDESADTLARWRGVCAIAGYRLEARLRPGALPLDAVDTERLCMAAAACAYGDYLMAKSGDGEVRVGDISVKAAGTASRDAADIRNYFLAQAADLLDCPAQPLLGVAG